MHTRVGYSVWWWLARCDCACRYGWARRIRWYVPTPPYRPGLLSPAGWMTPAYHAWRKECSEHNRRFCGPVTEPQSVGDYRWPFNEYDERTHRESERQRALLRARGYTFPVVGDPMSESAWRAWGDRHRQEWEESEHERRQRAARYAWT